MSQSTTKRDRRKIERLTSRCEHARRLTIGIRYGALILFAVGCVVLVSAPSRARAHSFLVRTSPPAGARLEQAPADVVLDFSEALARPPSLTVRTLDGRVVVSLDAQLGGDGLRARVDLPALSRDVYLVSWRVTAADGHSTEGEFAFAVGVSPPAIATLERGASTDWPVAIAGLAVVGGLAFAVGGLCSRRWLLPDRGRPRGVQGALAIALVGALGRTLVTLDDLGDSSSIGGWSQLTESRPGRFDLALLAVLAVTALTIRQRPKVIAVPLLVVASTVIAVGGHAGDASWWARPATSAHIAVGGAWAGALWHLAGVARRLKRQTGGSLRVDARRYVQFATATATGAVVLGAFSAIAQLGRPGDVLNTRYGRLLLAKSALIGVAVAVALIARRSALPADGERVRRLATLTTIESAALAAVVALSAVLAGTATPASGARFVLGPPPLPQSASWAADLAGSSMVTVAAAADLLQVLVTDTEGQPARDTSIEITGREPDGTQFDIDARACGSGCATTFHRWQPGTTALEVSISGGGDAGTATLEVSWPPGADASALLATAVEATRAAPRLDVTETVRSGAEAVSGPYVVAIDGTRFISGEPYAGGADDVRLIDDPAQSLTFVVPGSNIWGQVWLDAESRIVREVLVDPGHRIDRTIAYP